MTFLSPLRLLLLLVLFILAVAYLWMRQRRQESAVRFASTEMLANVVPPAPWHKKHLPATLVMLALTLGMFGFARPATTIKVPTEKATLIMAIDVSLSMQADDVNPTRFDAAKEAAKVFAESLPDTIDLGLVSFAGTAALEVTPTDDHSDVIAAIDQLQLAEATAVGDAILLGIRAAQSNGFADTDEDVPASIVILSDGETTVGTLESAAIDQAIEADIAVSTISFGTEDGSILMTDPNFPQLGEVLTPVPVAEDNLQTIAEETGGTFFRAESASELDEIYTNVGLAVGFEDEEQEVGDWFALATVCLMACASGLSLLWSQKLI